jgi:hypothetical protein
MTEIKHEDHSEPYFDVDISAQPEKGLPELRIRLGRVSIILGANGSGKSKLLSKMNTNAQHAYCYKGVQQSEAQQGFEQRSAAVYQNEHPKQRLPIFVAGGRAASVPGSENAIGSSDLKSYFYEKANLPNLTRGKPPVYSMYATLFSIEDRIESEYKQRLHEWVNNDCDGDKPIKAEPIFDVLFSEFNKIFPDITCFLHKNKYPPSKTLRCCKNGIEPTFRRLGCDSSNLCFGSRF